MSRLPTPVRHGLTLGELALLLQRDRYPSLELTVVPLPRLAAIVVVGLDRAAVGGPVAEHADPGRPPRSTPALCLVEATKLSEGRGTTRPFQLVGAPWLDPEALTRSLRALAPPGAAFRAARFRPDFGKHAGEVCGGVEIHVTDRAALRPLALGLSLLQAVRAVDPERFAWRAEPYEFVGEVPAIDLLTGSAAAREAIDGGAPLTPCSGRGGPRLRSSRHRSRDPALPRELRHPVAPAADVRPADLRPGCRQSAQRLPFDLTARPRGCQRCCMAAGSEPDDVLISVEEGIARIARGEALIVVDDEDRENEGDLIVAAEQVTPEAINFMARHGRGLICVALTAGALRRARPAADGRAQHLAPRHRVLRLRRGARRHHDRDLGRRPGGHRARPGRPRDPARRPPPARATCSRCAPSAAGCSSGPATPRPRST